MNGSMLQKPRLISPRRVSNDIDAAIMGAIVITTILKRKLKCWKDRQWKGFFSLGSQHNVPDQRLQATYRYYISIL
ncbi:MAG: hypothetical protein B0A82_21470 [Alkalinema sp. CACIAM 70d]|nr:MAG: hypothetical protein B0A82_21470 [Alkalinema sp. CACIAM 70d]